MWANLILLNTMVHPLHAPAGAEHIPKDKMDLMAKEATEATHEKVEEKARELREAVATHPSDIQARQRLINFLNRVGRAHEANNEPEAAQAVLRELLQLHPPAEAKKWDAVVKQMHIVQSTVAAPSCVAALPIPTHLPNLARDAKCNIAEVDASVASIKLLHKHRNRSQPLVVRHGAENRRYCSLHATAMAEAASDEFVKVSFPFRTFSEVDGTNWTVLDEVVRVQDVDDWGARFPGSVQSNRALVRSPQQWMRFKTFLLLAARNTAFDSAKGVYLHQCNVPIQIPELSDQTRPPKWARKAFGHIVQQNLWLSGGGTGEPLHFDKYENIHGVVRGRREFLLFPPSMRSRTALEFSDLVDVLTQYDEDKNSEGLKVRIADSAATNYAARSYLNNSEPWPMGFKCSLDAGDALYIPAHWSHAIHSSASPSAAAHCDDSASRLKSKPDDGRCLSASINWLFEATSNGEDLLWKSDYGWFEDTGLAPESDEL